MTIFSTGYRAETQGKTESDCPYAAGMARRQWLAGFAQSKRETVRPVVETAPQAAPFLLWSRGKGGDGPCPCCRAWGVVKPLHLKFVTAPEGEEIAARYRRTYPAQEFAVSINRPDSAPPIPAAPAPALAVKWKPISEERYWDMLGALPPAAQTGFGFLLGEAYSSARCTVSGRDAQTFLAFAQAAGAFWEAARPLTILEFKRASAADIAANVAETVPC